MRASLLVISAALMLFLVAGCGGETAQGQSKPKSILRLHGSTTVGPALEPLAENYLARHADVLIDNPRKYDPDPMFWWRGSEVGVAKVTLGLIDVGGCSRNLNLDELDAARNKEKLLDKLFGELAEPPAMASAEALKAFLKRLDELETANENLPATKRKEALHKVSEDLKKEYAKDPFLSWVAVEWFGWNDKSREMSDDAKRAEIRKQRGLSENVDAGKRFIEKLRRLANFNKAVQRQLRVFELRAKYAKNKLLQVALWDLDDALDLHGDKGFDDLLAFLKQKSGEEVTLKAYQVGYDALVAVVNKGKRGALKSVSQQQLIDIFFTGKIRFWDELLDLSQPGEDGKPGKKVFTDHTPIKARSRDPQKSGTGNAFIEVVNKPLYEKKRSAAYGDWVEFGEPVQLNQWAADDGDCFCYNGWGNLPKRDEPAFIQISLLQYAASGDAKDPGNYEKGNIGFVMPSMANFSSGLYKCQRPLFVITNGTPRGEVNRFIQFILDKEGQKIIGLADFVPVMSE